MTTEETIEMGWVKNHIGKYAFFKIGGKEYRIYADEPDPSYIPDSSSPGGIKLSLSGTGINLFPASNKDNDDH